jgi:hypothetical protein
MSQPKVNLTILQKLVSEISEQLVLAEADNMDTNITIAELSKCMGLATAIAMESTALAGDFSRLIKLNSTPVPENMNGLEEILGFGGPTGGMFPGGFKKNKN